MGISRDLRIEGPGVRTPRDDAGVSVEYLGVRVIIAARSMKPRDRGVWVIIQTEDGAEEMIEVETGRAGTRQQL